MPFRVKKATDLGAFTVRPDLLSTARQPTPAPGHRPRCPSALGRQPSPPRSPPLSLAVGPATPGRRPLRPGLPDPLAPVAPLPLAAGPAAPRHRPLRPGPPDPLVPTAPPPLAAGSTTPRRPLPNPNAPC
ncbi:hypothetical protein GUJ93_ZPchr0012g19955 [Zizania palustris]|uniref:Uncharacterized protein n=1 Tax=Zizania palustris TaxID=103762 RepID=A0A8J5WMC3_ZIZPA|nr:hypothetical protein GUJ93_ZPchr0012g19955 [Zizania palustris]